MPLTALTDSGKRVYAPELKDKSQQFTCPFCKGNMSFVDATIRIKHFRHKVKTDCIYEPETEEHEEAKYLVYKVLRDLGLGKVNLEFPVGKFIADVYLARENKCDIAFEIQATNYSFNKYIEKINYYAFKRLIVVYIFVGDSFYKEIKSNIFSLKEIEKRIVVEKCFKDSVTGSYLYGTDITIPSFTEKFAKGGEGYCENRFIEQYRLTKKMGLKDYLLALNERSIINRYEPKCTHPETEYKKFQGKIIRYKETCSICGKFIKWLPNKKAIELGLEL
jgi:competence CoiA-like predicted nuclease